MPWEVECRFVSICLPIRPAREGGTELDAAGG